MRREPPTQFSQIVPPLTAQFKAENSHLINWTPVSKSYWKILWQGFAEL